MPHVASSSTLSSTISSSFDNDDVIQYKVVVEQQHDEKVDPRKMIRYSAHGKQGPLSVLEWAQALAESPQRNQLAQDFNRLIQKLPYDAVYMETKGASSRTAASKPWEVAFLSAPRLQAFAEANPDPRAFGEHFAKCASSSTVCSFSNLGGDAQLISPLPPSLLLPSNDKHHNATKTRHYSHLAAFARHAPEYQSTELWTTVAREYYQRLSQPSSATAGEPKVWWLNTEGTGVAWLHVRLDRRPKYYHYMPFAQET